MFQPFKKLDEDIASTNLKSSKKELQDEIDTSLSETEKDLENFDPENVKEEKEDEKEEKKEEKRDQTLEELKSGYEAAQSEVSKRQAAFDEKRTEANARRLEFAESKLEIKKFAYEDRLSGRNEVTATTTRPIQESFESTDTNLLNEEGGLNISLENFKDNTPDASSLQQSDPRGGNLSVNKISKTIEIDKSVVNNKNMTTINNINQFGKRKRRTIVINSNNESNNKNNNMMQPQSSEKVIVVKEKSQQVNDLLLTKLGDL